MVEYVHLHMLLELYNSDRDVLCASGNQPRMFLLLPFWFKVRASLALPLLDLQLGSWFEVWW